MKIQQLSALIALIICGGSIVPTSAQPSTKVALTATEQQSRALGYAGIDRFIKQHGTELETLQQQPNSPRWQQLSTSLDLICQQRDCYASRLYWHTDFDRAKAEAKASNKPILSLRLLGNLDEELSCANSRFFRIALYSHPVIAKTLREKYILHWQSVRPVPKMTIDFGDGRKIEQTITGNSIHYILDRDGNPIDALPGLYAPLAFNRQLLSGSEFADRYHHLGIEKINSINRYHQAKLTQLQTNWQQDLTKLGIKLDLPTLNQDRSNANPPTALAAAPIAISKSMVELPFVRQSRAFNRVNTTLSASTNEDVWTKLGNMYRQDAILAVNSQGLMRRKQPQFINNNTKDADAFTGLVSKFENLIAIDSIRNEYLLHSQLHQWMMTNNYSVEDLNDRVYDKLFLTPKTDRWLGLMPGDGYTGIDRDGVGN
jgi:hypothetical protein